MANASKGPQRNVIFPTTDYKAELITKSCRSFCGASTSSTLTAIAIALLVSSKMLLL